MATASEAIMIELEKEGCEWIKSERFQKKLAEEAKRKEQENPMKVRMMGGESFLPGRFSQNSAPFTRQQVQ